jgi:hypothetical protein
VRFGQSPEDVFVAQIGVRNDDKLVVSGHGVVAVNHHFMNFTYWSRAVRGGAHEFVGTAEGTQE